MTQPMPCLELCLSHGKTAPRALEHLSEGGLTWERTQRWKGWQKEPCSSISSVSIERAGEEHGLTWCSGGLVAEGGDENGEGSHRDLHVG